MGRLELTPDIVFLLCLVLCICVYGFLLWEYEGRVSDTVLFAMDSWEYQSLGVNMYYGHGFKLGAAEDYDAYKFRKNTRRVYAYDEHGNPVTYYEFFNRGAEYSFYRTPGYPLFIALIYYAGGVYPSRVILAQLFLLAVSASALPFVGWRFWGVKGLFSGLFSTAALLLKEGWFHVMPLEIMVESLVVFSLLCWGVAFTFFTAINDKRSMFVLGLSTGALVLVKGTTFFIPLIAVIALFGVHGRRFLPTLPFFLGGCLAPLFLWSAFASTMTGSPVFISTQSTLLILDSNNEKSVYSGSWEPDWRKDPNASSENFMYKREGLGKFPDVFKLFLFWSENIGKLPYALAIKLYRGFVNHLVLIVPALLYYVIEFYGRVKSEKIMLFPLIYLASIALMTVVMLGLPRYTGPFMVFLILPAAYITLSLIEWGFILVKSTTRKIP